MPQREHERNLQFDQSVKEPPKKGFLVQYEDRGENWRSLRYYSIRYTGISHMKPIYSLRRLIMDPIRFVPKN